LGNLAAPSAAARQDAPAQNQTACLARVPSAETPCGKQQSLPRWYERYRRQKPRGCGWATNLHADAFGYALNEQKD
jgi:hypothetical protein